MTNSFHQSLSVIFHSYSLHPANPALPLQIHVIEGSQGKLVLRAGVTLPKVTITSYEMTKRLTCDACISSSDHATYRTLRAQVERGEVAGDV